MTECKGIWGKLFGHDYKSMIKEKIPSKEEFNYDGRRVIEVIDKLTSKKYVVCCKRCGDVKE